MPYEYYSYSHNSLNVITRILVGTTVFFFLPSFFFWLHHETGRILVPPPGIEPVTSAVKALSPNHWTSGKSGTTIISSPHFTEEDAEAQGG